MSYKARTIIPGWKLRDFKESFPIDYHDRNYIAVNAKKFKNGICRVEHGDELMVIHQKDSLKTAYFPDKQGRNEFYALHYFEWKPIKEPRLFSE